MEPPRELLEGTDLVAYVVVPESATFTGRLNLIVDGERVGRVACLAICRPHDDPALLLLHCDATWDVLGVQAWERDWSLQNHDSRGNDEAGRALL